MIGTATARVSKRQTHRSAACLLARYFGIVGVTAAIANAVFHATGKRVRDLPITLDKLP